MATRVQVVPQISQETFDQVVKENIDDFDMTPEEAVVRVNLAPSWQSSLRLLTNPPSYAPEGSVRDSL